MTALEPTGLEWDQPSTVKARLWPSLKVRVLKTFELLLFRSEAVGQDGNILREFKNNYLTEMCSGSEAGSYLRLIDVCIAKL